MRRLATACAALWLFGASVPATAQDATLVADSLQITADNTLVAEGNVEVFYDGTRLTAQRVVFDRDADQLTIEGPMTLASGTDAVIIADSADLDADLTDGILRSARLVLDQQLQIAAAEIARSGGRYTQITNAVVSSCEICEPGGVPVWEIRSSRAVRDEVEQQLYFEDAQLRVAGVPIFYLPRLRLPDPTLERATGFLAPSIEQDSSLGFGVKIPYFIELGDHADITLRPYLSTETTTLEAEYRHELTFGTLSFSGAASDDNLENGGSRAYLFAEGNFDLPRNFSLRADLELVSDPDYLLEYDYSDKDRLDSAVIVDRIRNNQRVSGSLTFFRTLRASELATSEELPSRLIEASIEERIFRDPVWGQAWASFGALSVQRPSSDPVVGRDVSRASGAIWWEKNTELAMGILSAADLRLDYDYYAVAQDPAFENTARAAPAASFALSWPLSRTEATGVRHLLTPTVQLAWSDVTGDEIPNEDSTTVEFDEGNLFELSRFPGSDAVETGLRANLGLGWTRYDPDGWSIGATVGRVIRFQDTDQFTADTGLSGDSSDWLLAAQYKLGQQISVTSRSLIDDDFSVNVSDTRFGLDFERSEFGGSYVYRAAEPLADRFDEISEFALDASWDLDQDWSARADWRYEADAGRTTEAGLGLTYENECIGVDLALSRRFTSSTSIEPSTSFSVRVFLTGFGSDGQNQSRRSRCGG